MPEPLTVERLKKSDTRFDSPALALYERELAYYCADEPYLTVEKCAERCATLSMLLTQAQLA